MFRLPVIAPYLLSIVDPHLQIRWHMYKTHCKTVQSDRTSSGLPREKHRDNRNIYKGACKPVDTTPKEQIEEESV